MSDTMFGIDAAVLTLHDSYPNSCIFLYWLYFRDLKGRTIVLYFIFILSVYSLMFITLHCHVTSVCKLKFLNSPVPSRPRNTREGCKIVIQFVRKAVNDIKGQLFNTWMFLIRADCSSRANIVGTLCADYYIFFGDFMVLEHTCGHNI